MRIQNDLLKEVKQETREFPPIRQIQVDKIKCNSIVLPARETENRIKSHEYEKWDKYDAGLFYIKNFNFILLNINKIFCRLGRIESGLG